MDGVWGFHMLGVLCCVVLQSQLHPMVVIQLAGNTEVKVLLGSGCYLVHPNGELGLRLQRKENIPHDLQRGLGHLNSPSTCTMRELPGLHPFSGNLSGCGSNQPTNQAKLEVTEDAI